MNLWELFRPKETVREAAPVAPPPGPTYQIEVVDGRRTITCTVCKMTSWNSHDVEYLFCGNCKKFHERRKFE